MFRSAITHFIKKNKYLSTRTFTYFIPAPPPRKTPYQEKEFDQVLGHILNQDFDLIDLKTQAISGDVKGMWCIAILGAKTQKALDFQLTYDYQDQSPPIEISTLNNISL